MRTRPDPGQNRLGPHKGIPSGEARQCTPAGTEAVISALAPTANQGGAECHHCGHPQQNRCPMYGPDTQVQNHDYPIFV